MDWIIGNEWNDLHKGLSKKILALKFSHLEKPTVLSICRVKITKIVNLGDRPSFYLQRENEFDLEMGSAVTPIDCYIEIIVEQMLLGETSACHIKTKSGESIDFEICLIDISPTKYLFELNVKEIYDLAQKYRANGVKMFKAYPIFAHDYFCRGAKVLISFKPFDVLTKKIFGINCAEMETLLHTLQTNICACLLQEQRNEDVLYLTEFVESMPADQIKNVDKALYRRAMALYNMKSYAKVLDLIEKVDNAREKKDFWALYSKTKQNMKQCEDNYKSIVQRMFT